MRITWVRHGQMDVHASEVGDVRKLNQLFNQEVGGGLTERGRREAARVARHFEAHPVDAVLTSPLLRAAETAQVTADALGLAPRIRDEVGELRTGHLPEGSLPARWLALVQGLPLLPEGAKRAALGATLIPLYFHAWRAGRTEGGETRAALEARLAAFHALLRADYPPEAHVAVFAHGYLIFYLSTVVARPGLGRLKPTLQPYIPNGALTEMQLDAAGRPHLLAYALTRHLDGRRAWPLR